MSVKPILFSGPMVQEILNRGKNQTRRVVKPQPIVASSLVQQFNEKARDIHYVGGQYLGECPYGRPGDLLWVRETWQAQNQAGQWWHEVAREERDQHNWAWANPVVPAYEAAPPRWLPSIHMPKAACRIVLRIDEVRVERLQDITLADAIMEGYSIGDILDDGPLGALDWFESLWNELNYARGYGWDINPWVWVVKFHITDPDYWPFDE